MRRLPELEVYSNMSNSIFKFKQFVVNQSGSAMKINTDGVLLAATTKSSGVKTALDIGTGTGVIALMLAQRFDEASIHALEINENAALCASRNFKESPFKERITLYETSFQDYEPQTKYDLIVSNPPYFINSLQNPNADKKIARHVEGDFFKELFQKAYDWLKDGGAMQVILPLSIKKAVLANGFLMDWHIQHETMIHSFEDSDAIRVIMTLSKQPRAYSKERFIIYQEKGIHTQQYRRCLHPYFINF